MNSYNHEPNHKGKTRGAQAIPNPSSPCSRSFGSCTLSPTPLTSTSPNLIHNRPREPGNNSQLTRLQSVYKPSESQAGHKGGWRGAETVRTGTLPPQKPLQELCANKEPEVENGQRLPPSSPLLTPRQALRDKSSLLTFD